MKRYLLVMLASAFLFAACTNEIMQPDPNRPFVENAVELCKSYIGMTPKDASLKMQQDWNYTAEYDDSNAYCYPPLEIIYAYAEDGKIYKVKYWRSISNYGGEQASKMILKISEDVGNFYEKDYPQKYYSGYISLGLGSGIVIASDHKDFLSKSKTYAAQSVLSEEKWKDKLVSLKSRQWSVITDSDSGTVVLEFILDSSD